MKKLLFLSLTMLISGGVFAGTDHYVLKDGGHVYHLKVTERNKEYTVSMDVDFEPNADEKGKHACSGSVAAEAKLVDKDKLVIKKHSELDAAYCELDIHLSETGAKVKQSTACSRFITGICHFSTDGKELVKIK